MCSPAQSQQKILLVAWQGSVSEVRSWMNPLPTSPTAASVVTLAMWPLRCRVLLGLGLGRGEELGDDLDREHAVDAAFVVDHGGVLGLTLQQVGEGIAHDVVAVEQWAERRVGPGRYLRAGEVALGEPAERAAITVDEEGVGDLGPLQVSSHL